MVLKVYNTLTRKTEIFKPINDAEVLIYVCGPTVYDKSHIGHARTYIAFDVVVRYLKYKGYRTKYIVNITNVEDKIIKRANELDLDPLQLAEKFESIFFEDMEALGLLKADAYPRVSDHIQDIIQYIQVLIDKGYGYQVDGDVYFDVRKAEEYGSLSGQSLEDVKMGARVELGEKKRFPADFALWKSAKPGEPAWKSPWGMGRPGWHIECSVLSVQYLGPQIDIHGGGQDLIFPHHENEILQSEYMTGKKPFAKYWLHTGMLNIKGEKMSKSLGNIFAVKDFIREYNAETLRLLVLSAHYRSPIDFTIQNVKQARRSLDRLYITKDKLEEILETDVTEKISAEEEFFLESLNKFEERFVEAMDDDFNTPLALATLYELAKKINTFIDTKSHLSKPVSEKTLSFFLKLGGILGILREEYEREPLPREIEALIEEREQARSKGDYEKSDRIRIKLRRRGIQLEDTEGGVKWRRLRNRNH